MIEPLKIKVRRADNPGIFHNSREDVRRLGEALNKAIDKINGLTDAVNRLIASEEKEH